MSKLSRRKLIGAGLGAMGAGAAGLAAAEELARRYRLIPPDNGGVYGPGETLTYAAQRILTRHSSAREFPRSEISKFSFANGKPPRDQNFLRLQQGAFRDWQVSVDGLVARPGSFSLAELRHYPSRSQITHLACEEGWSYIAEWTGVPLSYVLERAEILPQARYVIYYSIQPDWWDSVDIDEALHPQTLITYAMNGAELPVAYGGPIRIRVPRQLGYKSVKYITRFTVTDSLKKFGEGLGSGPSSAEGGYAWYGGI